jgi:hypothetical protein
MRYEVGDDDYVPPATPASQARRSAFTPTAAAAPAPASQRARTSTALTLSVVHQATAAPQGQYSQGFQGAITVFKPKAYSLAGAPSCVTILNDLSRSSGIYRFEPAMDLVNSQGNRERSMNNHTSAVFQQASNNYNASLASIGVQADSASVGISSYISKAVTEALLQPLSTVGMYNVAAMSEYMTRDFDGSMSLKSNPKHHFLFTPIMIKKDHVSVVNAENETETFLLGGTAEVRYNRRFWRANMECKKFGGGGNFWTLDIGFHQPIWTIPELQRDDHVRAMEAMKEMGPGAKNSSNVFLMTLKQYYAHLFVQEMETTLTAKAILAGFKPLFLIKNCLLQSTKFGINNHQFSTMDKQPKSYLRLCAYFKGSEREGNLTIIPITNSEGRLLSLKES